MSEAIQALCYLAGANSIFYGEKLLTTGNPETASDRALFVKLGLRTMGVVGDSKGEKGEGRSTIGGA
jgi:biotin synthase